MRVLFLGGTPRHIGGVEAFCERAAQALNATSHTHSISWLPTSTAYMKFSDLPSIATNIWNFFRAGKSKPEVVALQYVNLGDLLYLVCAKLFGYRVMVTPHLGVNWRSQRGFLRGLSARILGLADRLALISTTQEQELALPSHVPKSYVRNFLSAKFLEIETPATVSGEREIQLVHSGRLSKGKGSFDFVEVCAALKRAGVPFHARITGAADVETMSALAKIITEHALTQDVELLGRVPDDELIKILNSSDVLVHLSQIDSYPLIVLECLLCSVFPICLELAGARDMIGTYDGHIVSDKEPANEAAAFLIASNVVSLRERARSTAERVRADYSWTNSAVAFENALQKCLSNSDIRLN